LGRNTFDLAYVGRLLCLISEDVWDSWKLIVPTIRPDISTQIFEYTTIQERSTFLTLGANPCLVSVESLHSDRLLPHIYTP